MASTSWAADAEWELVNDDGFVYKRLKRPRLDATTTAATTAPPTSDPEAEERNRRERKKRILLNLKRKYQEEISQWEHLSNTLKSMHESALNQQQQQPSANLAAASPLPPANSSDSISRKLIDDLLAQVEAQEAIIHDISNLCNVAEAMCSAQEERMKKQFIDLPVWDSSPRELITLLSED